MDNQLRQKNILDRNANVLGKIINVDINSNKINNEIKNNINDKEIKKERDYSVEKIKEKLEFINNLVDNFTGRIYNTIFA